MKSAKIFLHNSLSHQLEEFIPLQMGKVSLYTCGPTVYDSAHLGHARSCLVWDVLVRFLRTANYQVSWARNLTDIDDKIIQRAAVKEISPEQLSRQETYKFWRDMQALNISWPDHEPKATDNLPQMFTFIQGLLDKGFAYQTANNDIYFRVSASKSYGQLKKVQDCAEQVSRINHQDCKQHNHDFALWKSFSQDEYGFLSPFGYGRPGWHLECSTMIKTLFGKTIDIHGGGEDLLFPHHENEIAQSEALHEGCKFANYWLHNGLIMVNGQKMSKSLGNFLKIEEALEKYSGNTIRFFMLSAHYRQNLNYTEQALTSAEQGFNKLKQVLSEHKDQEAEVEPAFIGEFMEAMSQDLNTPCGLAVAFELCKKINKGQKKLVTTLSKILEILGFNLQSLGQKKTKLEPILNLILELRQRARAQKDYVLADQIRLCLEDAGYQIKDSPNGTQVIY